MAATVNKVISIASDEVGYLEKATNAYLDDKTANAGYNNYTKYSRDLLNWIGSPYAQGVAWCDMFVDWCFIKAYGLDKAKQLLGGWSAYCPTSVSYFRNLGRFYKSSPKKGDVIFFYDSTGDYGHTGIVYAVDGTYVYTIEGNTSGASGVVANGGGVCKKSYFLSYSRIAGYGRPAYDTEVVTPAKQKVAYTKKLPVIPPILKQGCKKSIHVQRLQKFLNWYYSNKVVNGKKLAQDCIFGYNTKCGVMRFQQDMFPNDPSEWDGEFGQKSLAKAKTAKK